MEIARFEELLKEAIGLDVSSIGSSAIDRAVAERQQATGLADRHAYWEQLRASEEELQELIDAVVVPETWFFRDRGAFTALTEVVLPEWLRAHSQRIFRLLSVPCATGEEPYSLAMALFDVNVPAARFQIDAFDVSERALEWARQAVYGRRSFRGADLEFRDRHFTPTAGGYSLAPTVRQAVRFHQRNLLMPSLVDEADRYDVIFCRNLLIYFDRPTQDRAITVLGRLLAPGGMLFVGPSETGVMLAHDFQSAKLPMAFAFRRGPAASQRATPASASAPRPPARVPAPPPAARPARVPFANVPPTAPATPRQPTGNTTAETLAEAQRLADEGRFADAIKACEGYLRQHSASAPGHYLLGLIHDAAGNTPAAEKCYRKTIYLDPEHDGALVHLALLMDTQGRSADAQRLRRRVQRVTQKKAT